MSLRAASGRSPRGAGAAAILTEVRAGPAIAAATATFTASRPKVLSALGELTLEELLDALLPGALLALVRRRDLGAGARRRPAAGLLAGSGFVLLESRPLERLLIGRAIRPRLRRRCRAAPTYREYRRQRPATMRIEVAVSLAPTTGRLPAVTVPVAPGPADLSPAGGESPDQQSGRPGGEAACVAVSQGRTSPTEVNLEVSLSASGAVTGVLAAALSPVVRLVAERSVAGYLDALGRRLSS